jgi:serine/threonine-protein kinase RsbW
VTLDRPPALSLTIESKMACVGPLGEKVRAACLNLGLTERAAVEVELSVVEAVNNAIEHAYQLAEDRLVEVALGRSSTLLQIEVRDTGLQMPPETLAQVRVPPVNPADRASLPEGGMGLYVLSELMDTVSYESRAGQNVLIMERRIDRSERPVPPAQHRIP